ncbi:hypothetical protein [Sporosarcina sp. UB5]|uniref:hypothetical protein n=1 Tax=Sporosarcina sp. UB5 TaxID=3047463 RepID=UPI003D7980F0
MKRIIWLSLVASILLVAGCSAEETEQELIPIHEEDEVSVDEIEELDGQEPVEEVADQTIEWEHEPLLFDMIDGYLFIYGLKLGDAPLTAENIWGDPEILEEEYSIDGETYYYYPEKRMMIGYYEERLLFIAVEADEEDLQEIRDKFNGDHYRNPEGDTEFFYAPETGHLLIYGSTNSPDGDAELRLLMSDDNFFYYVDEGIYEKVN